MSNPSLILPQSPAYGEDYVYAAQVEDGAVPLYNVLPLTFTRASGGTRINKDGLVQNMPYNLLSYSEDFTNGAWTQNAVTITSNSTTAPNGTTTADTIAFSSGGYVSQTFTNNGVMTIFVYAKYIGTQWLCIENFNQNDKAGWFDIQNGVLGSTAYGATNSIENVGNGWYKCVVTMTAIDAASSTYAIFSVNGNSSFTRSGSAYFYGAQLNIGSTAQPYLATTDRLNMPRITYPVGGGCGALLLEKQSTNLLPYSEDFSTWFNAGGTVTTNTAISPDGTQNADTLTGARYQVGLGTGIFTFSCYAKKLDGDNTFQLRLDVPATISAVFNLNTGTIVSTPSGYSATIAPAGNGWYRCTLTSNSSITITNAVVISANSSSNSTYVYGAQCEASSYATSYIPTTSTSATRVADYLSRAGLALTNSTFFVNFIPLDYVVELFDFEKTGGGRMFYIAVQSNGFITFNSVSGGTIGAVGSVIPKNQTCKLAFSLNASTSNVKVYINGSIIGTYATNITTFGAFFGLQSFGYNPGTKINEIKIYSSVLTDAECQTLTS